MVAIRRQISSASLNPRTKASTGYLYSICTGRRGGICIWHPEPDMSGRIPAEGAHPTPPRQRHDRGNGVLNASQVKVSIGNAQTSINDYAMPPFINPSAIRA